MGAGPAVRSEHHRRPLEESAALAAFRRAIPPLTSEQARGRIKDLCWRAAGQGVTLLHDSGIGAMDGPDDLEALRGALAGDAPVRYRGMLVSTSHDAWMDQGLRPGFGDDLFRVDGIKAWADGSNQAGTGFQRQPYLGSDDRGSLNYSPEELAEVVGRAHADGWQVGVHANVTRRSTSPWRRFNRP